MRCVKQYVVVMIVTAILSMGTNAIAHDWQPADPDLIPEGRQLMEYLLKGRNGRIISGCQRSGPGSGPFEAWQHASGREPALKGFNIAGFHPTGSDVYHNVLKNTVSDTKFWWHEKGGIAAMLYHWTWPLPDGRVSFMKKDHVPPLDIGKMVTPGTEEYKMFHQELRYTADYLEQLAEARVPLLFRPFHEIDGGWFWWTDSETPEHTAALWRQMFLYLVKERGIHNLIWDFAMAHVTWGPHRSRLQKEQGRTPTIDEEAEYRRRFYPGDDYVDMVSISVYSNSQFYDWGWGEPMKENYAKAYELLEKIAPGKPHAVAESPNLLNPAVSEKGGPAWVYDMSWYGRDREWMHSALNHKHFIALDDLPVLHGGNVMPNVRIVRPADGAAIEADTIELAGFASDRNGNLKQVTIYAISEPLGGGPWLDWQTRGYDNVVKQVKERGIRLGDARIDAQGGWTFTWQKIPAGYHQLVALALDADSALGHSNVVCVTVGIENLALGRPVIASSRDQWGGPPEDAVDGDPWTSWWADRHQREQPQWLQVDLGADRTVGAVSVMFGVPHSQDYRAEVSTDGENWREVGRATHSGYQPHGVADVLRFAPVRARYVRLWLTKPAVDWMTYAVSHFGVYQTLPKQE
ncbi:MAG: glycosyl hydrolase [Thermogutta sp.]